MKIIQLQNLRQFKLERRHKIIITYLRKTHSLVERMFPKLMVKSTGLFTPLRRSKHYTTRQLCWHDNIYQHLNKHRAGNNFHVWTAGVFERSLKQSYLLSWRSVQEASFFFFPHLNVFMAEARPG